MDCEQAKALVSSQIDGEIVSDDRESLHGHLADCAACRELATTFRLQDSDLRRAFAPRQAAAQGVADRVIDQLRATVLSPAFAPAGHPARIARRLPWVPMILSAAAGFLIAVLIFRPWQHAGTQITKAPSETPDEQPIVTDDAPLQRPNDAAIVQEDERGGRRPVEAVDPNDMPPAHNAPKVAVHNDVRPEEQPPVQLEKRTTAALVVAIGVIEMLPPGREQWERMGTGGKIEAGTRVRTGPEGRCEFLTQDGSEVRLNGNSELVFHTNRKLELAQGQLWSTVAKDDDPYRVQVPRAEATVTALGTQFDIECKPNETLLTVVEGVTQVEGTDGKESVRVHAKERARIVGGAVAEKQRVYNLVIATSWVHEILKLKGHDNPELAKRMDDLFAQIGEGKMTHLGEKEILDLGDHCVLPLTRFIQSDRSRGNKERRVAAARILAKIAQPWSIPDLIELLADDDEGVRYHAAAALERLTSGETQGITPQEWTKAATARRGGAIQKWQEWWEKNKVQYPGNPLESPPGPKLRKG